MKTNIEKMENMKMEKLALTMSLPMIFSMITLALYNIVDGIFVSQIDGEAFTAISLVAPIQSIIIAIALGTGVGISSLLSRKLGENKLNEVRKIIANGIVIMIIAWICIALLGLTFSNCFMKLFSQKEKIIIYGRDYISICMIFCLGNLLQIIFQKIMEAMGRPVSSMIIQFSGAIINLILDPIFIWGFGIIPSFGVKGAAIATVISQFIGMSIGIFNLKKEKLNISLDDFKLDKDIISQIYIVGFPTIMLESISAFVTLILNKIFALFSESAISVWGIYNKVQSFLFMIVYGLNNGMIPIVGYNFGAKNKSRVKEATKVFLIYAEIIMFIGMIIFLIFSNNLLLMFNASGDVLIIGNIAFKILSSSFLFSGISLVLSAFFQAIGMGKYSLIIFLLRQLSINIPLIYLFGKYVNVNIMWIAFVLSELLAMIVSILLLLKNKKKIYGYNEC